MNHPLKNSHYKEQNMFKREAQRHKNNDVHLGVTGRPKTIIYFRCHPKKLMHLEAPTCSHLYKLYLGEIYATTYFRVS